MRLSQIPVIPPAVEITYAPDATEVMGWLCSNKGPKYLIGFLIIQCFQGLIFALRVQQIVCFWYNSWKCKNSLSHRQLTLFQKSYERIRSYVGIKPFALGFVCSPLDPAVGLCAWPDDLHLPPVVICTIYPAKSCGSSGVCRGCVISVEFQLAHVPARSLILAHLKLDAVALLREHEPHAHIIKRGELLLNLRPLSLDTLEGRLDMADQHCDSA